MSELYDTTVFIDYWRGDTAAVALIDAVIKVPGSASYSSLSVAELWQHPKLDRREEIEYVALTRHFLQEAPLDAAAAMRAGTQLRAYSRNARRRLAVDALIAATAERRGECIRTRNWKDIQKFYSNVSAY